MFVGFALNVAEKRLMLVASDKDYNKCLSRTQALAPKYKLDNWRVINPKDGRAGRQLKWWLHFAGVSPQDQAELKTGMSKMLAGMIK